MLTREVERVHFFLKQSSATPKLKNNPQKNYSSEKKFYTQYPIQGISQSASGFRPYLVIPYGASNPYVVTVTSLTK